MLPETTPPFGHKVVIESRVRNPKYTIAIPTYKRHERLHLCIASCLEQDTTNDFEIVIIDNDPDGELSPMSLELIELAMGKVAYYKNDENVGMFNNWTQCFYLAKGQWVTMLCDDDRLLSHAISTVERTNLTDVDLIFGNFSRVDGETGNYIGEGGYKNLLDKIESFFYRDKIRRITPKDWFWGCQTPPGLLGAFFRKSSFVKGCQFLPDNYPCADYYALSKFTADNKVVKLQDVIGVYCMGVNEYLRPEVLNGFVDKNYQLRKNILWDNGINTPIYNWLAICLKQLDIAPLANHPNIKTPSFFKVKLRLSQLVLFSMMLIRITKRFVNEWK